MLLVVVEDLADRLNTRVVFILVGRSGLVLLVPIQNTADEGRDQSDTSLCASNGLAEAEEEGQVAMNAVIALQLAGGLDTLPGGGDLDEDTVLLDTDGLVESNELLGLRLGRLLVEGQTGVDLCRDTTWDDLENLLAELDEL